MPGIAEMVFVVTAYAYGCGATGLTYTERFPHAERTVAADPAVLPFFSEVAIEGIGVRYVEDIGSAIKGNRIDVFMQSCAEAKAFGRQTLRVMRITTQVSKRRSTRVGGWRLAKMLPQENHW